MDDERTDGDSTAVVVSTSSEVMDRPEGITLRSFPQTFPVEYEPLYQEMLENIERETLSLPEFGTLHQMMVQRIMAVWVKLHAADNDTTSNRRYELSGWAYRDMSNSFAEMTRDLLREGREILRDQPYREEIAVQLMTIMNEEIPEQFELKRRILDRLRKWVSGKQTTGKNRK